MQGMISSIGRDIVRDTSADIMEITTTIPNIPDSFQEQPFSVVTKNAAFMPRFLLNQADEEALRFG
jgi:hypothetical protein